MIHDNNDFNLGMSERFPVTCLLYQEFTSLKNNLQREYTPNEIIVQLKTVEEITLFSKSGDFKFML